MVKIKQNYIIISKKLYVFSLLRYKKKMIFSKFFDVFTQIIVFTKNLSTIEKKTFHNSFHKSIQKKERC